MLSLLLLKNTTKNPGAVVVQIEIKSQSMSQQLHFLQSKLIIIITTIILNENEIS
jgi:hypothetical protein